ncbi:MAG: HAD-IC family P-type ATPase [Thermomicrobiales bacterium]|nr:HAD-IC family P-type ATPase [Thermomicrobiales bacterium]
MAAGKPPGTGRSYLRIVRDNLFTFINMTLVGIGVILIGMGMTKDAVLAAGLAVVNGVMGVIQEAIAKRRLDRIALLSRANATVIRDGVPRSIDPSQIVVGDVLSISPGDQIMVDGRVVGGGGFEVDESLLTGESDAISKQTGDRVFSGSFCVAGGGRYEAEQVGQASLTGTLAARAKAARLPRTPLQRDVVLIVRLLLVVAGGYLALVLLGSWIHDVSFQETVLAAAVVLGIVPSGLFLMITVTYSMAAIRLADEHALVQQINAVESLSNVDVFCMDKTGTLTANRLMLSEVEPIGHERARIAALAGRFAASVSGGTKTSAAILAAFPGAPLPVVDEIPFSSERKWSAAALDDGEMRGVFALGAPEMLLPRLQEWMNVEVPGGWMERGLRVLLFAYTPEICSLHDKSGEINLPGTLAPAAWLGFADELRPNLRETLDGFARARIEVKVISGDNPETVAALARQAGIGAEVQAVSGIDLATLDDATLAELVAGANVFGRITPEQKERLVRALKARGHYVAMTGDGVNDVLALKQADLGIAMQSGSQATRAIADIVLLNDSFSALPKAFREGQRIRNGLQSILELFLTRVFAVAIIIACVVVLQASFPFSPGHMTLLTLLTVGIPTFGLALWATPGILPSNLFLALIRFVVPSGLLVTVAALGTYLIYYFGIGDRAELGVGASLATGVSDATATARSALTTVMVLTGLWLIVFSCPPSRFWAVCEEETDERRPTWLALAMIPLYVVILAVPGMRSFFGVKLLTWIDYAGIVAFAIAWGLLLRYVWAWRLFDRFLGVDLQERVQSRA